MKQAKLLKMIRGDIDYDSLDIKDPKVAKAVKIAEKEIVYNSRLYDFLTIAYDFQKKACLLYTSPSPRDS